MRGFLNLFGIGIVWFLTTVAWLTLGGVTKSRQSEQASGLRAKVSELWGQEQVQAAPVLTFRRELPPPEPEPAPQKPGAKPAPSEPEKPAPPQYEHEDVTAGLASSRIETRLHSDPRQKGLVWYALYDVAFQATYAYVHEEEQAALLKIAVPLPASSSVYDDLVFAVDGAERSAALDATPGMLTHELRVEPKQKVTFVLAYKSRGADSWRYAPAPGVSRLNDFRLSMLTDFTAIDFPAQTLSPSRRTPSGSGFRLDWDFRQMVTGQSIGMVMPAHIQPGELAAALSYSAPVSLMFFFVIVFVLSTLRRIDVHPINYLMIAAAFFAFHLLFAYSVDHLSVKAAFALSSSVSLVLVVSYLRLVVSNTFAFREAALAQLVYLVGFSLAHFWEGFTGLTITVLGIVTLFVLMQLTGRVRWHDVLGGVRLPNLRRSSLEQPGETAP